MPPSIRNDSLDFGAFSRSRSTSLSSDSQSSRISLLSPPPVNPIPAFVSPTAASEIVVPDQDYSVAGSVVVDDDDEDDDDHGRSSNVNHDDNNALVTPGALSLLNGFLDHLLFNILAAAKSTKLGCIRPALADVLRPRFAKEVVSAADDELSEYVNAPDDDNDDDDNNNNNNSNRGSGFDLLRAWKVARLRCMIYTRLGDLEEDDEYEYILSDGLGGTDDFAPGKSADCVLAPATAVFLTSIVEYIAERALVIAGQTARVRLHAVRNSANNGDGPEHPRKSPTGQIHNNRLVVQDADMEKLALNPTLGRLWRTWRKRVRPAKLARTLSRESIRPRSHRPLFPSLSLQQPSSEIQNDEVVDLNRNNNNSNDNNGNAIEPSSIPLPPSPASDESQLEQVDRLTVAPQTPEERRNKNNNNNNNNVNHDNNDAPKGTRLSRYPSIDGPSADTDFEVVTMEAVVAHKMRPRSLMVFSSSPSSSTSRKEGLSNSSSPILDSNPQLPKSIRHVRSKSLPSDPYSFQTSLAVDREPDSISPSHTASLEQQKNLGTMYERDEPAGYAQRDIGAQSQSKIGHDGSQDTREGGEINDDDVPKNSTNFSGPVDSDNAAAVAIATIGVAIGDAESSQSSSSHHQQQQLSHASEIPNSTQHRPDVGNIAVTPINDTELPPTTTSGGSHAQFSEDYNATSTKPQDSVRHSEDIRTTSTAPDKPSESPEDVSSTASNRSRNGSSQRSPSQKETIPSRVPSENQHSLRSTNPAVSPAGTERAAVQRLSKQRTLSLASSNRSVSRGSDSLNSSMEKRSIISNPPASPIREKLKGLINRSSGDPVSSSLRTSSDTRYVPEGTTGDVHDDSCLDKLIQSDETIRFTLTPRNMREIEETENSRWQPPRSTTSQLTETAPPAEEPARRQSSASSSSKRMMTTNSLSPAAGPKPTDEPKQQNYSMKIADSRTKPPQRARESRFQPRDARPITESTLDFAEFIRSTGPKTSSNYNDNDNSAKRNDAVQPPAGRRVSATANMAPMPPTVPVPKNLVRRDTTGSGSKRPGPRLQARSAAPGAGGGTSDLIDFIRTGPPTANGPRIPSSVAPFTDPDQAGPFRSRNNLNGQNGMQDRMVSSTANSSRTSFGSSAALLGSADQANSQAAAVPSSSSKSRPAPPVSAFTSSGPRPVRRQLQARDPCVVDRGEEDEDDDELNGLLEAPKSKRGGGGESMMDFLNKVPPPNDINKPPQPLGVNSPPNKNSPPRPSAVSSTAGGASSMKRVSRKASWNKIPSKKNSGTSLRSSHDENSSNQISGQSNYSVKVGMERIPQTTATAKATNARPATTTTTVTAPATPSNRNFSAAPAPAPTPRMDTETGALADFLKNTGPPEPPSLPRASTSAGLVGKSSIKEFGSGSRSFSRLFSRRRKLEV